MWLGHMAHVNEDNTTAMQTLHQLPKGEALCVTAGVFSNLQFWVLANDGRKKTAATSALCKPLRSFPCPASSCWKVPDEVICTSNQYAAGHFTVTNLGKSNLREIQNSLKGLFMDEGSPSEIWLRQRTPVISLLVRYYKNLNLSTYKKMEVKQSYNSGILKAGQIILPCSCVVTESLWLLTADHTKQDIWKCQDGILKMVICPCYCFKASLKKASDT